MAVIARDCSKTYVGADVAVFTVGATDLVKTFTNVRFGGDTEMVEAMSVLDFDSYGIGRVMDATLDFSKVVEGLLPLMDIALSTDPRFVATIRPTTGGPQFAGTFGITSAKWSGGQGAQEETCQAHILGPLTITTPAASVAPTRRVTQASTRIGKDVSQVVIGTDDYAALFKEASIEATLEWADASAAKDDWRCRRPISRKATLNVSKVAQTGDGDMAFSALWLAHTSVAFQVETSAGDAMFSGNAYPRNPGWEIGRAVVDESLALDILGGITLA